MLEDQVASLLQRYLGNYVRGLNKEALKISVWRGDVELKNMQLKPEALNALKLPVKVKAGFLGSVRIEVPWSRLGQEPVIVYLDRILILAEPATHVEESNEDAIQEAKRTRVQEMESRLLEGHQLPKSEMTSSWLGSFINTIIGNLRLSITNVHIRYEDLESNPGHPFAAGLTLGRLSAFTIDDAGKETFVTGDALDRIQKSVELERLALYLDSDISPWSIDKRWEDLLPSEWSQIFELEPRQNNSENIPEDHRYFLQPVTGNARYTKLKMEQSKNMALPLQKASVNLEDVTLCLSEDGYKDILRLADNFSAFNKRLKYAHYRPHAPISSDPRCWWKYAFKVVTDEAKNASGIVSWDQLLRHAKLRKRYVSLYASLLKYSRSWDVAHGNEELKKLDQELDMNVILQWRMLAHEFVMQSTGSAFYQKKQKTPQSWWSFGWTGSSKEEEEESDRSMNFTEEDWERLNKFIGYKESDEKMLNIQEDGSLLQLYLEFHMKHNASKLIKKDRSYLADLSCDNLDCSVKVYSEAKIFDLKLGSYRLSSPNGLLAESATVSDSLVGVFSYKPFGAKLDWSFVAKASPCYMTYLKDSIHNILSFFKNSTAISQTLALETAAAVQMTLDEVKRSAQKQFASALRDHTRFFLDLDISAPKITIPAEFHAKNAYTTRLLLDLGHLKLLTQDEDELSPSEREYLNFQFNVVLSDVSAFMVDEEYSWSNDPILPSNLADLNNNGVLPVIDKCGIVLKLQQVRMENPLYQGTRLAFHLPVLAFHFSPARYHRLMEVFKLFQDDRVDATDMIHPWSQADFGGWLSILSWKGVGNREAVWQRRYLCVAGQFLYVLENPSSTIYKQCYSLRGKQVHQITLEFLTEDEHILALCDAGQLSSKVVEDANAIILHCGTDEYCKLWQSRIQGAIYRTSGPAVVAGLSDVLTPEIAKHKQLENEGVHLSNMERFFVTGILDELKIRFDYNSNNNQSFEEMLLGKESGLLEFKAIGGQVEVSIRENDLFIGTILKSLEIQDLFHSEGAFKPRYLAKSFIKNIGESPGNSSPSITYVGDQSSVTSEQIETDAEEKFYEAYDNLSDVTDSSIAPQGDITEFFSFRSYFPSETSSIQTLSFNHVPGLLPDAESLERSDFKEPAALDSFVKAQIIIFDQGSSLYTSIDKQVMLSVGSLSFFFHRPTILATMEFINAVNAEDIQGASQGDASANETNGLDNVPGPPKFDISQEPIIKGLLGRGKSRAIFYLMLNMARAQIFLMNEDEKSLGTLSQNNLLVDIKVFPSSFQIKAALGNLKISDDSLPLGHSYFWVCDMRNPDGSSFVKLDIESYNPEDEDYPGYDYSLIGELSEIRLVYLNRFIQELLSYFTGLASTDSIGFVRLKDKMTDSEKWFTTAELQGSPALKLDLSLSKPIILMPRGTHSLDYLQLDVPEIAVQNTFQWLGGDVNDMNAVRLETMTIKIKDINLTIGTGTLTGESIIQDVKGLSIIIQRSLRDLLHQIPSTQIDIKVIELSASLSNKEYEIVAECALSNISETPDLVPPLSIPSHAATTDEGGSLVSLASVSPEGTIEERIWDNFKMMISIGLVELSLHSGAIRDSSLATVQVHGAWVLYRSDSVGQAFLSSTLMDFSIIDNREGTLEEFRLAIGKHESVSERLLSYEVEENRKVGGLQESEVKPEIYAKSVLAMLILDVKFKKSSTIISLCVQRPHLLVALDFLLAVVQFFVPTVQNILTDERDKDDLRFIDAIIPDQIVYTQPSPDFSLSPMKPLIIESEKSDHLIYDGKGGHLCLNDRLGTELSDYSAEPIIFIGNGKRLQFKNVHVKNGRFLDSCIYLGANSSYSASEDDNVSLGSKGEDVAPESPRQTMTRMNHSNAPVGASPKTEYILEFQAISPGLTFYSISGNIEDSLVFSTKLLHAQFDMFCRVCMKDDAMDLCGDVLGLTLESNGIRVLEPFTINASFSNTSGKTKLHVSTSDIYVNFSFSILKLFMAIQDDILEFMRMTTNKFSVVCSQFDKVGTIQTFQREHTYAFWRPRAPPGFAVLGDCLTPLNEPPTKGVTAVNISFARVKRPVSFRLIWPSSEVDEIQECKGEEGNGSNNGEENGCSLWFPVAPKGYVAVGCVVSPGRTKPPLSSALCISSSFVSSCPLKDCISFQIFEPYSTTLALWRVDNSFGSFLPTEPSNTILMGHGYDLRHLCFRYPELVSNQSAGSIIQPNVQLPEQAVQSERYPFMMSGQFFEHVSSFRLIWWNQGTTSSKKLSIWRPVIPEGTAYFGDIAVHGYEPPDMCMIARNIRGSKLLRPACGFQLVGHIQKGKGAVSLSIWLPQPPPGFVSLGCIASKGPPKQEDISTFRCVRSDFITSCTFLEESIWDSSDTETAIETFSIWVVSNEACTFFARKGLKRPPKRFALTLIDSSVSDGADDTVIDLEMKAFSATIYDDYAGLMVPLCNIAFSQIGFCLRRRLGWVHSSLSFSLETRSYNDKIDSWEPFIEPIHGVVRYQDDLHAPGVFTQLRITTTKDLNIIVSVSNTNMILQAYSSWNSLNSFSGLRKKAVTAPTCEVKSVVDIHRRRNYHIIPRNKLGQDIYIRVTERRNLSDIIRMPSGDNKLVNVPVSKNLMDSHLQGKHNEVSRSVVSVIVADAEFPPVEELTAGLYTTSVRLFHKNSIESSFQQAHSRTRGAASEHISSGLDIVEWNEAFVFKVDDVEHYVVEFTVINIAKDAPVGSFSTPLKEIAVRVHPSSRSSRPSKSLCCGELSRETMVSHSDTKLSSPGRIRFSVLIQERVETLKKRKDANSSSNSFIQISPTRYGPWTTVRLNYAAPAACWRLGNDVIASELSVLDGNRYVNIRSLVSVTNKTDYGIEICLKTKALSEDFVKDHNLSHDVLLETDELFETEKFVSSIGWVGCSLQMPFSDQPIQRVSDASSSEMFTVDLPAGWEWVDGWHIENSSTNNLEGWIYAPNSQQLKWPESSSPESSLNTARQRKWVRRRKLISSDFEASISLELLKPGETLPLPLKCLVHPLFPYYLQLRPRDPNSMAEYSWSKALSNENNGFSDICVSKLSKSDEILCCMRAGESSSDGHQALWFCLSIQSSEIRKDIHSDPIHDWNLVVDSPLSITNFLPLTVKYSIHCEKSNGHLATCHRDIFQPGETSKVYNVDLREALYLSLLPRGWEPVDAHALVSHPNRIPAKTLNLRSCFSGRVVSVILDQSHEKGQTRSRLIRLYVPYWISAARCPPLAFKFVDLSKRREGKLFSRSTQENEKVVFEIFNEEMHEGDTISAPLKSQRMGVCLSLGTPGKEKFGPAKDLLPLSDMDGSVDLFAYDTDGSCFRVLISSKPCRYQAVPIKVLSIRPYMTFTNRVGQDIFIRFNAEDEEKVLSASDTRVSFIYREIQGTEQLQVRMEDTEWSFPVEILKEDTITLMLRNLDGGRKFLRLEVRGHEEGSQFLIVFRPGSSRCPIRIENRLTDMKINIRQSTLGDDAWVTVHPHSCISFALETPYGPSLVDFYIQNGNVITGQTISLETTPGCYTNLHKEGFDLYFLECGDTRIIRILSIKKGLTEKLERHHSDASTSNGENQSCIERKSTALPVNLVIELGVVGISLVDHRPRELLYLSLEKVFLSYSSCYDGGNSNRFKLIIGQLQMDNQLPFTVMPVLFMPERTADACHPVFKATISMSNDNIDGTEVYPYVYIRVTENYWRVNIHEPIIWALVDFYNNIQIDRASNAPNITVIDPEIRIKKIDVSEMRFKVSLETSPTERPHGVLGIWSPLLSAVGNAFKVQIRLRKVVHDNRFMRKSAIAPAIINRVKRDLVHNPLHLILSVDVLGMTKSTLASLSKGFAELSTDVEFLQLRSKQVWSRKITSVSDGILQGTEAFAQGLAFGVSGVVTKPVESAREYGILGVPQGFLRAILGVVVQPVSGVLDFVSLTVDGIGASFARCLELLSNKSIPQRIRNPRAFHANGLISEYSEREATGQMILYLAETSRHFGCTDIFKEPSKFAWSDLYEDHFLLPHQRILLITNKRALLLLCLDPEKIDKRPCKIVWDVPWEELLALELAKAGYPEPSHLIIHLKNFRKSESFVRLVKCNVDFEESQSPQAVRICSAIQKMWKARLLDMKTLTLRVPSSQRYVQFAWDELASDGSERRMKSMINTRRFVSSSSFIDERRFVKHVVNFQKIWSSERDLHSRCILYPKQVADDAMLCSLWRPVCPDGYVSIGDIARLGIHPPTVAAVYRDSPGSFAEPVGFDLVWRNCTEDYTTPLSIWSPRPPEGFASVGCVAVAGFEEPTPDSLYCVNTRLSREANFEDQIVWTSPDSYPWSCYIYAVQSEDLHLLALRQPREVSSLRPLRVYVPSEEN